MSTPLAQKHITDELLDAKEKLISYMFVKIREQDWHGVADCAMDLRDIESEMKGLKRAWGAN